MNEDSFEPTREQFISVAQVVHRMTFLLSRADAYKPTEPAAGGEINLAAAVATERTDELLANLAGRNGDAYAKDLGWPSADALIEFLFGGMAPPE